MIVKALGDGKYCVWDGFAHRPVDGGVFTSIAAAQQHLQEIVQEQVKMGGL